MLGAGLAGIESDNYEEIIKAFQNKFPNKEIY